MNRTLKDLMRAMMLHKSLPEDLWAEAISTAAHIRNRVTSQGLPRNTTPYFLWHGLNPDVSHFKVFGSQCWYKITAPGLQSLSSRSHRAIFIGYAKNQKGYKL